MQLLTKLASAWYGLKKSALRHANAQCATPSALATCTESLMLLQPCTCTLHRPECSRSDLLQFPCIDVPSKVATNGRCAIGWQHGICAGASEGCARDESECRCLAAHCRREGHVVCYVVERQHHADVPTGRLGSSGVGAISAFACPSGMCPGNSNAVCLPRPMLSRTRSSKGGAAAAGLAWAE